MDKRPSVGILGAGITGLSTAWMLKKQGIGVAVYEKTDRPGGKIRTFRQNGWLVEEGPNTILVRDQRIWDLLDELNLKKHVVKPGAGAKKRYIVRDGALRQVPMSIIRFLKSCLFSTKAKLRLLKEPFITASQKEDENIANFIKHRLGTEPLEYAVDPFISGVYAGDPEKLSAKHTLSTLFELEQTYGSLTKGFLKRKKKAKSAKRALISFDKGLDILPQTIVKSLNLNLRLNSEITQIAPAQSGWKVTTIKNGEEITHTHQVLVSTLLVHQQMNIWSDKKSEEITGRLQSIEYAPISMLALGFHQNQIGHSLDGFGMLIPSKEPYSLLGCLFSSALFPGRAPEGHVLLTCFIGGARNPKLATDSTQVLTAEILPQLHRLLKIEGEPVFQHHCFWEQAIPQYTVGYQTYLDDMGTLELQNPGLFLAGNFRDGVSVPDCIVHGFEAAEKVKESLNTLTIS